MKDQKIHNSMNFSKIKSFAKVNLALNIIGKSSKLHKIESLVTFINLYDLILIKKIKSKKIVFLLLENFQKILIQIIQFQNYLKF